MTQTKENENGARAGHAMSAGKNAGRMGPTRPVRASRRAGAPHADGPRLLADVGGTHARFALETGPGAIGPVRVYACREHADLVGVIRHYLHDVQLARIDHAALAIAYPGDGDRVRMTNLDWTFSIEATRRALGLKTLFVVNDFAALAHALPYLADAQFEAVGAVDAAGAGEAGIPAVAGTMGGALEGTAEGATAGARRPHGVIGLLGPGTGLGVSGLVPCGERWVALASEGGHASFAPQDEREDRVLRHARGLWPHVSSERVASGPGIELIYRALAPRDDARAVHALASGAPGASAADIIRRAHAGDARACETVTCFCGILGAFAGNLAVTLGARGGIYVGGGIVLRLGELFKRSPFRQRFEAKGRLGEWLARVPTYMITAEHPAFAGIAGLLEEYLG